MLKNKTFFSTSPGDSTIIYVGGILSVVLILTVLSFKNYVATKEEYESLSNEMTQLHDSVDTVKANQTLAKEDIDTYNKVLAGIIPESEDYFSIIVALEKLSQLTNFQIVRYNILLANTNPEKLALLIEGDGDSAAFLKFLSEYRYSGGRLITNEKMEFANTTAGRIKMNINFYHKAARSFGDKAGIISRKDVNLVKDIQGKINLTFTPSAEDEVLDTQYNVSENPF